jgi:hypothetical protein
MLRTMGQALPDEAAIGTYDHLSNLSHPTLYPHHQMTIAGRRVESSVTVADHDEQARIAVVPYYETLAYVMHVQRLAKRPSRPAHRRDGPSASRRVG